eukprot:6179941-Prymnesium_polylepis.1
MAVRRRRHAPAVRSSVAFPSDVPLSMGRRPMLKSLSITRTATRQMRIREPRDRCAVVSHATDAHS